MNGVATRLISQRKQQRHENKLALKSIIDTKILCNEQEIPLRVDNDSNAFSFQKPTNKDGKFFFEICGNLITKKLITDCLCQYGN